MREKFNDLSQILIFLQAGGYWTEEAQEASQRWIFHVALFMRAWAHAGFSLGRKYEKYSARACFILYFPSCNINCKNVITKYFKKKFFFKIQRCNAIKIVINFEIVPIINLTHFPVDNSNWQLFVDNCCWQNCFTFTEVFWFLGENFN